LMFVTFNRWNSQSDFILNETYSQIKFIIKKNPKFISR
jgi:hypothetical protein